MHEIAKKWFCNQLAYFQSRLGKKHFLWTLKFWEYWFGRKSAKITINFKLRQDSVNQLFNPNALFLFLLTGATWYYHAIYIVLTYFASLPVYEDDILEVISNLHVKESKFGGKICKFGKKTFKKLNSAEFMEFVFSMSGNVSQFNIFFFGRKLWS